MVRRTERDSYNVAMLRAVLFELYRPTRYITCISSAFLLIGNAVYRPTVVCLWLQLIKHRKNKVWGVSIRSLKRNAIETELSFSIQCCDYLHGVEGFLRS
jgi:hypothetical protein